MPGKLIGFILTLLIIVTFIGFNYENQSDIRFWFGDKGTLPDVPIFISFFVMYLIGVVSVVPFVIAWTRKRISRIKKAALSDKPEQSDKAEKKVRVLGADKKRARETKPKSGDPLNSPGESDTPELR